MTIGALSLPVVLALVYSRPIGNGLFEAAFGGAIYGGITAIACLLNRPKVEQVGAGQPATRFESDSAGGYNPQPDAEVRPR